MIDDIIERSVMLVFRMLHRTPKDDDIKGIAQFVKFGIVGVTNTIVGYLINVGVIIFLRPYEVSWDYVAGNIVSFILSVLWSFYWNNRFVFTLEEGQKRNLWTALLKTYASYAFTGIILNNVLSYLWVEIMGVSKMIAPLINMMIGVPINYFLNKLWAFRSEI